MAKGVHHGLRRGVFHHGLRRGVYAPLIGAVGGPLEDTLCVFPTCGGADDLYEAVEDALLDTVWLPVLRASVQCGQPPKGRGGRYGEPD